MRHAARGFSMIELLIAMVIVAMIAAFAVPQYSRYVIKSELMEAVTLTEAIRVAMIETHINNGYFVDPAASEGDPELLSIGLTDGDSFATDVVETVLIGLDGGNPHSAHILVQLTDTMVNKAGLGADPLRVQSTLRFDIDTQSYEFSCNAAYTNGIDPDVLPVGC